MNLIQQPIQVNPNTPWFDKKFVLQAANANGTVLIKLLEGDSKVPLMGVKLNVLVGNKAVTVRTSTQGIISVQDPALKNGAQITVLINDSRFVPIKKTIDVTNALLEVKLTAICSLELIFTDSN